ncbi:MAG: 5'-methylthioadenosine/adenosylhomocysteine nucleosidase, partial [Clostridia bacterium]|nr:5'-methylthioadenosine/adenosylhomocysteine nucleosidase [Clostridia bacterium]
AELLEDRRDSVYSGVTFHEGRLCGADVVLAVCGVGKVFAAICAQTMILKYGVDVIINTGVAGGLHPELKICDAVIAERVVQHDMDTSPLGDPIGLLSGINVVYIDCDGGIVSALEKSLGDTHYLKGTIASGDVFVADDSKKSFIRDNFDAYACEMEGAAIGHVCFVNGIPFGVLRTISDGGDDMDYITFAGIAAEKGKEIILKFLEIYK